MKTKENSLSVVVKDLPELKRSLRITSKSLKSQIINFAPECCFRIALYNPEEEYIYSTIDVPYKVLIENIELAKRFEEVQRANDDLLCYIKTKLLKTEEKENENE